MNAPCLRDTRPGGRCAIALALLGAAVVIAGCSAAPFSKKDPRTQYDRYDAVRNQYAPPYIEDEFGRQKPNLRGRLTPKQ